MRKARNHALMVAGGLIVNHAPCGNWKRIDWDRLADDTANSRYLQITRVYRKVWQERLRIRCALDADRVDGCDGDAVRRRVGRHPEPDDDELSRRRSFPALDQLPL